MTWWGVCRDFNLSSIASVKAHYVSVYLKHFQTSAWTFSPCYLMKYGSVLESSFLLLLLLHSCRMLKSLRGVQTLKVHHVSYLNQLQLMYECFLCTAFTGPASSGDVCEFSLRRVSQEAVWTVSGRRCLLAAFCSRRVTERTGGRPPLHL